MRDTASARSTWHRGSGSGLGNSEPRSTAAAVPRPHGISGREELPKAKDTNTKECGKCTLVLVKSAKTFLKNYVKLSIYEQKEMVCNQVVAVYISGTPFAIEAATVTCTGHTPQITNRYGLVEFSLSDDGTHSFRADAEGYAISSAYTITGCQDRLTIKLEKEEQIQITVKRPTWVSMELIPAQAEYPTGEELHVYGYARYEAEPYVGGEVWLIDADAREVITESYYTVDDGFYVLKWTPSVYKEGGYNVTVGCDAFVSASNPLGAWSLEPNGSTKNINVIAGAGADMQLALPNPYSLLFVDHTIIVCDDWEKACTGFRFQIRNDGAVTSDAWYKVSIVSGSTLYSSTIGPINPGATSVVIDDTICALPGGLPVGTHEIKVEAGPTGMSPTDTYTEEIFVIEEPTLPPAPIVATFAPFNIEPFSALLRGYLNECNDLVTDVGFEYGETISYGNTTWEKQTSAPGYYAKAVATLIPDTTYHVRAIVENEAGTGYGLDETFTTPVTTEGFGIVLPNDTLLENSEVWVCDDWEKACTYFNFQIRNNWDITWHAWYTVSIVGGGTLYSKTIRDIPGYGGISTVIHDTVCALPGGLPVGEYGVIIEVGPEDYEEATDSYTAIITVKEYGTPVVSTEGVESPTLSSATLVGTLKDSGIETRVGFEYGLQYGSMSTIWREGWIREGEYKVAVRELEGNETYRFRAVATAGEKVGYGEEKLFETVPAIIDVVSLGWNLEDAKVNEYNAHFRISQLSESKRYRLVIYGGRGHEFARIEPVSGLKEEDIKSNIPLEDFEEYGYMLSCGVYDLDTGEWLITEGYPVSPLKVTVDMAETIATGGIPQEMETRTDTPFSFIVSNESTIDLNVDVYLSFKGISTTLEFPRDIIGLEPSAEGYILPGSDILVWDEGFIARNKIVVKAGESSTYTLTVMLPDEAVPIGNVYADYTIHTRVGVYLG